MRNVLAIGNEALTPYAASLEDDGFHVVVRAPGEAGDVEARFDTVILELGAVAEDAVAKHLLDAAQAGEGPPVIAMIGRGEAGALDPSKDLDDFFVAGADPQEVCARVRQVLWKRHRVDARNILKCGDLVMDLANYTVHIGGHPVELTYKEYELLRYLATNRGRVINRETLLSKVWGYDFYGGARTVDVHIRRLRSKIEDRHNTFIETVRNVGYRFRAT